MTRMHPELIDVLETVEPADRRVRLAGELGRLAGESVRDGRDLTWLACRVRDRARQEGTDGPVWAALADVYDRWDRTA